MHTPTPRRAFTLVELMVVIGIVATLMVLLLPAVNSAVESGRRTQCVANQTKLASAMAMYDSRNNFLPGVRNKLLIKSAGSMPRCSLSHNGVALAAGARPIGMSTPGWFIMLLPMLERQDLFDGVIGGQIWMAHGNAGTSNTGPSGLANNLAMCPSAGSWHSIARIWNNLFYRANGAGMASTPFKVDDGAIGDNANGIYATMADIAAGDGSANTLLITEQDAATWYPYVIYHNPDSTHPCFFSTVGGDNGGYQVFPEPGGGHLFGFSGTPTATTRIINGGGWFPSSVHPGGAVAAFADGSTRFLRQDLQPHVYGHLVTRRSVWNGTTYSTNSPLANGFLQCSPAPKPYTLKAEDY
jgi:prepilin-type N-terminal cleavage/methylation domain-containing protein/prepilin-type processing-associated H-X9-DG protein